jgi:hypothetical protein
MPRFRSGSSFRKDQRVAELRRCLEAEPDHMLSENAIARRQIVGCRTLAAASSLISEYERVYGPGRVRRGKLDGGKRRVVCLDPVTRTGDARTARASSRATRTRQAGTQATHSRRVITGDAKNWRVFHEYLHAYHTRTSLCVSREG